MSYQKTFQVNFKESGTDGGSIVAYAATFDREPDSYGDVIAPGAFTETIKAWNESGQRIPLLFGHRTDDPEMNIGGVDSIEEDERGLKVSATFDADNPTAQYVRKLVKEKRLNKLSFAYDILDAGTITLDDGTEANELRKLDIFEVSLVPIPANRHAEVIEVKSADDKASVDEKACAQTTDDEKASDSDVSAERDDVDNKEPYTIDELADRLAVLSEYADRLAERIESLFESIRDEAIMQEFEQAPSDDTTPEKAADEDSAETADDSAEETVQVGDDNEDTSTSDDVQDTDSAEDTDEAGSASKSQDPTLESVDVLSKMYMYM